MNSSFLAIRAILFQRSVGVFSCGDNMVTKTKQQPQTRMEPVAVVILWVGFITCCLLAGNNIVIQTNNVCGVDYTVVVYIKFLFESICVCPFWIESLDVIKVTPRGFAAVSYKCSCWGFGNIESTCIFVDILKNITFTCWRSCR